jgi:Uma2 family endonuclease
MDTVELEEFNILEVLEEEDDEMPNYRHGELQTELILLLRFVLRENYTSLSPITFQGMSRRYTPDVVVYPKRTTPHDKTSRDYRVEQTAPLLAVEIISPDQTMYDMVLKCSEMLASGVEECWIVEPANETVTVCRKDRQFVRHRGEVLEYALCTQPITVDEIFDI